jgi:hypothetical protein
MSITTRNALIALGITLCILATIVFTIRMIDAGRVAEVKSIESQIAIDALSLETQFSLLASAPCENATSTEIISELADLGERLAYTEDQLGKENAQVIQLKKQYTLLEIRDHLATKQLASVCHTPQVSVLYFYTNTGACNDCDRAGYALSYLRKQYPSLRVYSFDYHLDLGALKTLIAVNKVKGDLPAFVINGKPSYGFVDLADLTKRLPISLLETTAQ